MADCAPGCVYNLLTLLFLYCALLAHVSALQILFYITVTLFFSPFTCCFSVGERGNYPENSHVVFLPNKQRSFEPFICLDLVLEC